MEAEAIRDSILAASGRLDRDAVRPERAAVPREGNADRRLFPGPLDGDGRRSIYIKNNLMEAPKFLGAFNFPGGKVTQGRRDVTNVPAQALALLNDPFVCSRPTSGPRASSARPDASVAARIDHLFRAALGRPPDRRRAGSFERRSPSSPRLHGVPAEGVLKSQAVWKDVAHAMFNLKEFIYIP